VINEGTTSDSDAELLGCGLVTCLGTDRCDEDRRDEEHRFDWQQQPMRDVGMAATFGASTT
jgi:hypothetical protein